MRQYREQEGRRSEEERPHAVELEERAPLRGLKREREAAQAAPLKEPKKMLSEAEAGLPPSDGRFDDGGGSTSKMAEDCQQLPSPPDPPASDGGSPPEQSTPPHPLDGLEAISSAMASSAGAPLRGGQQGLEDCRRRMDLINAARRLRGLPVRLG